jgi:hypothetical protein
MRLPASLYFGLWGLALTAAWFGKSHRIEWLLYVAILICLLLFVSTINRAKPGK